MNNKKHMRFRGNVIATEEKDRLSELFDQMGLADLCKASQDRFLVFDEKTRIVYQLAFQDKETIRIGFTCRMSDKYVPGPTDCDMYVVSGDKQESVCLRLPVSTHWESKPLHSIFKFAVEDERRYTCPLCGAERIYCEEFDSEFCPECDIWLDDVCDDPKCEFCAERPEKPSDIPGLMDEDQDDGDDDIEEQDSPSFDAVAFYKDYHDAPKPLEHGMETKLSDLDLSVRAVGVLKRAGIVTLNDLSQMSLFQLWTVQNMRDNDYAAIIIEVAKYGVFLSYDI